MPAARSLATFAALLGFACLAGDPALAAWPHDPYNGNLALCSATGLQFAQVEVSDGAGGAIVAWQDFRNSNYDIYVQRVSSAGVPLWTANGVGICTATGNQHAPDIISDGAGGAIVTWHDQRAANYHIYAQRVNASGAALWTPNGVLVCGATLDQLNPRIVPDGAGGTILAWQDFRNGLNYDLYAQRLNASGTLLWGANGVPLCLQGDAQVNVHLATDGAGGAIAVWDDFRGATYYHPYAQRVNAAGSTLWTANGVVLCTAAFEQRYSEIASDGSGGAIVTWQDFRNGTNYDIYAQRLTGAGTVSWGNNGAVVCSIIDDQQGPRVVSDGAGGAVVVWADFRTGVDEDIYAQRMSAAGNPLWTTNGIAVGSGTNDQQFHTLSADGLGGVLVAWEDFRSGASDDIYAQRLSGAGVSQWTSGGVLVCGAVGMQYAPEVIDDGAGGAIVVWQDFRASATNSSDVYAQRVDRSGQLGNPEPSITAVKDVPADQGGRIKVAWNASFLDVDPTFGVFEYRVWRSVPQALLANGASAARRGLTDDADEAAATGKLLVGAFGVQDYAWEFVASTPAAQFPSYSMVVNTESDSIAGFNRYTVFKVEARASSSTSSERWSSAPDSGYSVDNLPPAAPAAIAAFYSSGSTRLAWNPNHEGDLAGYRLYRGTSATFVPSASNLVAAQPDTGYVDPAGAPYWYKLTAVDVHGNESPVAALLPSGTLGLDGTPVSAFFAPPSPNPARDGSALRFGLTRAGHVRLEVLDAAGRSVRVLADGAYEPGEHALRWDGRDDAGRAVAPGLYFVRLAAPGLGATRRLAVIG